MSGTIIDQAEYVPGEALCVGCDPTLESSSISNRIVAYHALSTTYRARMLDAVGIFDELDLAEAHGLAGTRQWLQRELKIGEATSYEFLRVARGIRTYRYLFDAFEAGDICYTTVRWLLSRITPENEIELARLACELCFTELEQALAGCPSSQDKDPDEPYLKAHVRDDGKLAIHSLLPAVVGQEFLASLKIAELAGYGIEDVSPGQLVDPKAVQELLDKAEGTEEACPGEQIREPDSQPITMGNILNPVSRYGPPEKDAMYSAFLNMIQMVRTQPVSPLRTPGAHVHLMVTEDGRTFMPQNPSAPSQEVASYLANANTRLHFVGSNGLTLYVGHSRRFATDGQVQALLAQWHYQCAMPGCNHRRFLQVHHIKAWEHGGATNLDNLIPLCSSCHSNVSCGIVQIHTDGADIYFTFNDGSQFVSRNRMLPVKSKRYKEPPRATQVVQGDSFAD